MQVVAVVRRSLAGDAAPVSAALADSPVAAETAPLTLENFVKAWHAAPFARYFVNTALLVTMILACQLVLSTLAAYAFARFDFRGRDIAFMLVLVQLMIMPDVLIVENYRTMSVLGILDTLNLFLAGGAMRDMLGGFPIRDLDFTVEGNALKLAKVLAGMKPEAVIDEECGYVLNLGVDFRGGVQIDSMRSRRTSALLPSCSTSSRASRVVRSVVPASSTLAMFGWSIMASACRSASNRATTCLVSMPSLMTLSATLRRTGSFCSAT